MLIEVSTLDRKWYRFISKPQATVKNIVGFALRALDVAHYEPVISVVLGNDPLLLDLNSKYRKINKPTNVLSFSYEELCHGCCLGEIFISIDRIVHESSDVARPVEAHFTHILIHGVLHILGYDHEVPAEAEKMQALEIQLLEKFGIPNPYSLDH